LREIPDAKQNSPALRSSSRAPEGGSQIITVSPGIGVELFDAGTVPGAGSYFCALCSSQLSLRENDQLPECPRCGTGEFLRDSIFEPMQEHGQTIELAIPETAAEPEWLPTARAMLPEPGRYVALREGDVKIFPIPLGWTRIGRSAAADIRLDDPSVSRRHALIVSELPDTLRILDDRSLNGVFLNGKMVDWGRIEDGDELAIGRFRLYALEG